MKPRLIVGIAVWVALMVVMRLFTRGHEASLKRTNDIANENLERYVAK
jgi:hypothetical protein